MRLTAQSSLTEVAYAVCTELHNVGVTAVLTGGSAATIWSNDKYQSRDCDFIITFARTGTPAESAILNMGYTEKGGIYRHSESPFTVEFPKGPLSVGWELINNWDTLHKASDILHILTPTDSCRDRLAAFYHWNDYSSLKVAVLIAKAHLVDLDLIERWSAAEDNAEKFRTFKRAIQIS